MPRRKIGGVMFGSEDARVDCFVDCGGSVSVAAEPDHLSKAKRIDRWGFG